MFLLKIKNLSPFLVFVFFASLVFITFRDLLNSYFEADEWFHFTHYLPITRDPYGFLTTFFSTFIDTQSLSRGQHVVPIGEELFFLNTLFFKVNYTPYALITIFLHVINSFLVFLFVKELLDKVKNKNISTVFALLGGTFFALGQIHFHAVAWAAFYGQNNLSVTFFLLCVLFFKKALNKKRKIFLSLSLTFLLLDLFTKETATALFVILPVLALFDRSAFSSKYLTKIYIAGLIFFITFRFIIPTAYIGLGQLANRWADNYIATAKKSVADKDTGTIVSTDLSIHENIYRELAFRALTFPVKMTSEFYFPRDTIHSMVSVITPVIYPQPGGGDEEVRVQYRQFFLNGPGNDFLVYILSVFILTFLGFQARRHLKEKKLIEFQAILTGLAIIFFAAMPLVLIVLSFPRWGYDTYFDSRHYYMPSVGAAIVFPFLIFGIGNAVSKIFPKFLRFRKLPAILAFMVFAVWLVNNLYTLNRNFDNVVDISGSPRRRVIEQLKSFIPVLRQKAVFYIQTDGLGAYGALMPFQTPFPQVLTVVYYDKNPLPNSFFKTFIFEGKPEGYKFSEGRGFGFFNTKKSLVQAILEGKFSVDDVNAFYYDTRKVRLSNITQKTREELNEYLQNSKANRDWVVFDDPALKILFKHPKEVTVFEVSEISSNPKLLKTWEMVSPQFYTQMKIFSISPTVDLLEIGMLFGGDTGIVEPIKVYFDKLQFNDAVVVINGANKEYFLKLGDKLIQLTSQGISENVLEKVLGSASLEM